jgi:threonine/homoserine/homoserine lactone efflux protein
MPDLSTALGDLLPAALGVAISPVPIIATVLMLLSTRARVTAPAFAAGWMLGITAVLVVVLLIAGPDGLDATSSSDVTYWIRLALGLLFLLLALRSWHTRPRPGQSVAPPKWMNTVEGASPPVALGLGAALSAVNPKNLALAVAGGVAIASNGLSTAQTVFCVVVFVVLASALVAGPVIAFLVAGDRTKRPLGSLKDFMETHNAAIMVVLLGVLALSNLGKGIGGLVG